MRFECTNCRQNLDIQTVFSGQPITCPLCGTSLIVPDIYSGAQIASFPPDDSANGIQEQTEPDINATGITIPAYMAERGISGGIDLTSHNAEQQPGQEAGYTSGNINRYEIGDVIAKGGMGVILNTRDINILRDVAMKVILDQKSAGRAGLIRFIEEAQITGQLEHPGMVPVHELGVDSAGNVFYTMKLVRGKTLQQVLKEIKEGDEDTIRNYPLNHLLIIFQTLCDTMAFAHSKGVIHRDLKPENVMLGDFGEVKVMDWGLAKTLKAKNRARIQTKEVKPGEQTDIKKAIDSVRRDSGVDNLETVSGSIMGTPGFMAPEQALGKSTELDERADIYSLGSILYNILTLNVPVEGKTLLDVVTKISTGEIPHPSVYNPPEKGLFGRTKHISNYIRLRHLPEERIPAALGAVAMKALDIDPQKRYQNVKDLQKDIKAYQNGFATSAERAGPWTQAGLLIKRNKAVSAMLASILALIFFGLLFSTTQWVKADKARQDAKHDRERAREALLTLKDSAPDMAMLSRQYILKSQPREALNRISFAAELDPGNAEYLYMKGNILQTMLKLEEAAAAYTSALESDPSHRSAKENLDLCRSILARNEQPGKLRLTSVYALYLEMRAQGRIDEAISTIASSGPAGETIESFMQHMLDEAGVRYKKVVVDKSGYCGIDLSETAFADLPHLKNIPIRSLDLTNSLVSDLTPLKGIPLNHLNLHSTRIADISPIKGMPLIRLNLEKTDVTDLAPLEGMPLESLNLAATRIEDLSQIRYLPLATLNLNFTTVEDLAQIQNLHLNRLELAYTKVTDLAPLQGMPLIALNINDCPVTNLSPLSDLPLSELSMRNVNARDFRPLKNLALTYINIAGTRLTDFSIFLEMPLSRIAIDNQAVSNLSTLAGMKTLTRLCNANGDTDSLLQYSLFEPVRNALEKKNLPEVRKQATKILTDWKIVPAMSNLCHLAVHTLNIHVPMLEKQTLRLSGVSAYAGHHYMLCKLPITWNEAELYCRLLGGHLATLTTEREREWACKTFPLHNKTWLGGTKDKGTMQWKWVTNEKWDYTCWGTDKPIIGSSYYDSLEISDSRFNDVNGRYTRPFLIEWEF